jgi:hypothetical protein
VAIVLDGWAVVARRSQVEARLGGFVRWFEIAPTRVACADRDLCCVAFMVHEDASAFLLKLESMGLQSERDGSYRDVALVGKDHGPWQHACPWLQLGRYAGVSAVWMDGTDPDPLVVPLTWQPDSIINLSAAETAKRLKFLRRDGGVEVYLDTETGKEMYRGRTAPSDDMDPAIEQRFQAVVADLKPLLTFNGPQRSLGWFERRRLAKGIRELEAIASGYRWRIWWYLGIARRAAADATGAFDAFQRAYDVNPTNADVSRELGGQCLALGRGDQAVMLCDRNCSLHPDDAGLRSNLALACMVAGDMKRAKAEITRALEMDPSDKISRVLDSMIDDVITGKRPRLTKYP